MKIYYYFILILIFLILSKNMSYSQIKGNQTGNIYTLDQCIDLAMKQNPEVLLANASIGSSAAAVTQAFGSYLPSIDYSFSYNSVLNPKPIYLQGAKTPYIQNPNSYSMNAQASLVLYNGFSREDNYSRTKANLNLQYMNIQATQLKVKLDIYRQYFDLIRKSQILNTRKENLELGKKELEKIKAQQEAGVIHIGMVYTQEAELGSREFDLVNAENDYNKAKALLLVTMGKAPEEQAYFIESAIPTDISDSDLKNFRDQLGSFNKAVSNSYENRIDYAASKANIDIANIGVRIARSSYMPTVSAYSVWSWNNSTFSEFNERGNSSFGLNFSLPIFDNFRTNYQIETAQLQVKQREIEQIQLEQSIKSSLKTAYLNLDAAEKQIDITSRALKAAENNYNSYKARLDVGSANITEYLDANNRMITARINRITAVYTYYQYQKEIQYIIGKL